MYFENSGKINTVKTLELVAEKAARLGIQEVVLATTNGDTAFKALEILPDLKIVAVTYHCGFRVPFQSIMPHETRKALENYGVRVVSATHALSGVERGLSKKHAGVYPVLLVADTLKLFGQGTKVAVEVSIMAADAGYISGKDIIAVGGSSKGADTALVIKPSHQSTFFDLKIREIICKPRDF